MCKLPLDPFLAISKNDERKPAVFFQHQWEQGRLRHSLKERNLQLQFDEETRSNSGVSAKLSMDAFEVWHQCHYMSGHEMAES